jgi:hypothetical protein
MENPEDTVVNISPTKQRRSAPRKAAASGRSRKPAASGRSRKPAPRRKRTARATSFEDVIRTITGGVSVARAAIAEASGPGVAAMRRAVGGASKSSRKTVKRLAAEWKAMDPKKKAGILAALLGAAAAASAPLLRKSFKK